MAQNSARDFTLPSPTPTATPNVQGPVDDSGIVPVGPRVIPTERPSPRPIPSPATSPAPPPTATPTAMTTERATQPRPGASSPPRPTVAPASEASAPSPAPDTAGPTTETVPQLDPGLEVPPSLATPLPQITTQPVEESWKIEGLIPAWLRPYWIWTLSALGLLMATGAIWKVLRQRSARAGPPAIEPPLVTERTAAASTSADRGSIAFDTRIEVESFSRSFRMVTVKYRIEIANRSERAMRDLSFGADLVSAARGAGARDQLANTSLALPAAGAIDRIGPHQSRSVAGVVQMPVEAIEVFAQGQIPMFVPLLRLRIDGPQIGTQAHTYALGLGGISDSRVNPLPLNNPLGSYQGVRAVRVDQEQN